MLFELEHASVFIDFDGTITTADTAVHLLERLGRGPWHDIARDYASGAIGSRECLLDEWALLPHDEATLRAVASEVEVDAGFVPLVAMLRAAGAEVTVVSDGFGILVDQVCAPLGVDVITNAVDFASGELLFPHLDRCCPCSSCGVCKQAPIKDARARGRYTVLVGDGVSDRKAASIADVVFAKGQLARWCRDSGLPFVEFETLDDVRLALW